jgi:S-adenosylmethionine decarboxylase
MESHFSIHTWPEHGYAAVDLFVCTDKTREVEEAIAVFAKELGSKSWSFRQENRGPRV